ncbi:MAG: Uma2 family endonuclease [Armatimonadota bacterium]|nr:Uma2 family endonuclease [Armatimonadota bacterium]MDR7449504.1 Uma2 family endonuclease [Armatimonadota bacterium]MDR7460716.1 Uma2 family endonuclease [Armatimonadota bacterium]MDR7479728.1 Uma2 family endonuclease [Armatimonadota bacterium]MDR7489723.1 Uma2 family endonuclease [Armatimonadota bacterium]
MAHGKLVLTYQDYLRMPDDGMRRELLGGDLHVTPAPGPSHQRVVLRLAVLLDAWVRRHALGEVFPAPVDVVLSEVDVVQPEVGQWLRGYSDTDSLQEAPAGDTALEDGSFPIRSFPPLTTRSP